MDQFYKPVLLLNLIVLPLWLIFRLIINYSNIKPFSIKKECLFLLLVVYVLSVAAVTIVPLPMSRNRSFSTNEISLIPFATTIKGVSAIIKKADKPVINRVLINFTGNIFLFIPLGLLLPLMSSGWHHLKKIIALAALASLSIELIQFISLSFGVYRYIDIDDVILNTLGAIIGYWIFKKFLYRFGIS
jgi:glycopeptide antibiotics resistance protein